MPYETFSGGLELVIPTNTTQNWGTVVKNATWKKINDHQHTGGGDGNKLNGNSFSDHSITEQQLSKNLGDTQQDLAPAGTTQEIDWDQGRKINLDLSSATGDVDLTMINPKAGASYRIKMMQGGTKRGVLWPATVKWPQSTEPTQFSEANWIDVVYLDFDGSNYLATFDLNLG